LRDEGNDPAKFIFGSAKTTPSKPTNKSTSLKKKNSDASKDAVEDESNEEINEEEMRSKNEEDLKDIVDQIGDVDEECLVIRSDAEDDQENYDISDNKESLSKSDDSIDDHNEMNHIDDQNNEDKSTVDIDESINLTIGEEEEKFLNDEVSSQLNIK